MFGWLTFYHQGHEVAKDFKPYMTELQLKIQKVGCHYSKFHCLMIYEGSINILKKHDFKTDYLH